jgi:cytochrome P450
MKAVRDHGNVVRLRFGPKTIHLFVHPDDLKVVMQDHYREFGKASRGFSKLKMLLGEGLLTSDGAFWQRQRRISQPAFHQRRIAAFARTMTAAAEEMAEDWHRHARAGGPLDIASEMMRITLTVVVRTLLGSDLPEGGFEKVKWALEVAIEHMNHNIYRLLDTPAFVPSARRRRFEKAVELLDGIVLAIIEKRRRAGEGHHDLLQMLMDARDEESGEGMTDEHLRDEVMTILLAGHETTAIALTWTWYLLSRHAEAGRRLPMELDQVLSGRPPTLEDLPRLTFTTQVLRETLRLYPPLWAFSRIVKKPMEVGGYALPAGSFTYASPYATHRLAEFWPNPEGFDPERFPDGQEPRDLPKFAYMPFGGGPRNCIGSNFALLELQMIVPTLAQRFRLEVVPGYIARPEPMLTLRPQGGLPMFLHPR